MEGGEDHETPRFCIDVNVLRGGQKLAVLRLHRGASLQSVLSWFTLFVFNFFNHFSPQFCDIQLIVIVLSHRCNSRTNTLYNVQPCQRACAMGQGHPGWPIPPLTRTTLGQLCFASWVSWSWPAATQFGNKPRSVVTPQALQCLRPPRQSVF